MRVLFAGTPAVAVPSLNALVALEERGVQCDFHDPFFPELPLTRDHASLAGRQSVAIAEKMLGSYDAVAVLTDHTDIDYEAIADNAKLIFDARNAFASRGMSSQAKVVKI